MRHPPPSIYTGIPERLALSALLDRAHARLQLHLGLVNEHSLISTTQLSGEFLFLSVKNKPIELKAGKITDSLMLFPTSAWLHEPTFPRAASTLSSVHSQTG
jgi:hypothetical protein